MKTAMILAAGRGERMRPLTDVLPKPLLEVCGKPLIEYHIEKLADAGVKRLVVNHAWLGEKIEQRLGGGKQFGVDIHYSAEGQALETAGGIVKALPLLCPTAQDNEFIVINGDVFSDFDVRLLPDELEHSIAHLVMVDNPDHNPDGDFGIQNGTLTTTAPKLTFSGIAVYNRRFFDGLKTEKKPLAPLLRKFIEQQQVTGQKHRGIWCDVGTPERLQQLNNHEG